MHGPAQNPKLIVDLATAYWGSMALFAALDLGVFTRLDGRSLDAGSLAAECAASEESLELLLNAACAHGLLAKSGARYTNTPLAETYLVEGRPAYLGEALRYAMDLYPVWGDLAAAVRAGGPATPPESLLGVNEEKTRHFVLGMHNRALGVASALTEALDLGGRRWLLDVGGGPGTYSMLLVERTPGLRATVLDLPGVLAISRELIAERGLKNRIDTLAGDYLATEFPPGVDAVLMSGMLHREREEGCRRLLGKAFRALAPGGVLAVADVFFANAERTAPPFSTLFALTMMLTSDHGAAHAESVMLGWMSEAGFTDLEASGFPPPMQHRLLLGRKA
jgi:ubiquinone/menaquinone biosynthesis C-methylase UbiE